MTPQSQGSRVAIYALTKKGTELGHRLKDALDATIYVPRRFATSKETAFDSLMQQVAANWRKHEAHIFIAAAGIAIRAVAPHLSSKAEDSAVVCMDQEGHFAVSLLAGHVGGANRLAEECAEIVGGQPVITTATDSAGLPSVDLMALDRGLRIGDWEAIKHVNAAFLEGRTVQLCDPQSRFPNPDPRYFSPVAEREWSAGETGVWVSWQKDAPAGALPLHPHALVLGMGCRKGTPEEVLEQFVLEKMKKAGLAVESLTTLASHEAKSTEPGLLECARRLGLNTVFYPTERLCGVAVPNPSETVKKKMGTGSVCEASAIVAAGGGPLVLEKSACESVTMAVSLITRRD